MCLWSWWATNLISKMIGRSQEHGLSSFHKNGGECLTTKPAPAGARMWTRCSWIFVDKSYIRIAIRGSGKSDQRGGPDHNDQATDDTDEITNQVAPFFDEYETTAFFFS